MDKPELKTTPKAIGGTFVRPISLSREEDDIILAAAAEWGVKYATATRRIIREWLQSRQPASDEQAA